MAFFVSPTATAKQDARDILSWLLSHGADETGLRWFYGMQKAIASLREMPTSCNIARESKNFPFEVRQLPHGSTHHCYRILFTIEGNVVTVRLLDASNLPDLFDFKR